MKNVLMMIVSLAVGYGLAYLSASKNWAPFNNSTNQEVQYSKTISPGENTIDSGIVAPIVVTESEMLTMSKNYVAWINQLNGDNSKGSQQKKVATQTVIRGGRISASLLDKLAKSNKDVFYLFGKYIDRSPIYLLLSDPFAPISTEQQNNYYLTGDSASMCPCVCPEIIRLMYPECPPIVELPVDKLPPIEPDPQS